MTFQLLFVAMFLGSFALIAFAVSNPIAYIICVLLALAVHELFFLVTRIGKPLFSLWRKLICMEIYNAMYLRWEEQIGLSEGSIPAVEVSFLVFWRYFLIVVMTLIFYNLILFGLS